MSKPSRKLFLLPAAILTFAALFGAVPSTLTDSARYVNHYACPEPFQACCCGTRFTCVNNMAECDAFCS